MQSAMRLAIAASLAALGALSAATKPPRDFDPCDPARAAELTAWLDECAPDHTEIMPPTRSLSPEDAALFHPFADEPPAD